VSLSDDPGADARFAERLARIQRRLNTAFDMIETLGGQMATLKQIVDTLKEQADAVDKRTFGPRRYGPG
jgi:hypothetical protein